MLSSFIQNPGGGGGGLPLTGGTLTGALTFSGTTHAGLQLLSLTTAQKNALTAANGMLLYDSDLGRLAAYAGGAWTQLARLGSNTFTAEQKLTYDGNANNYISIGATSNQSVSFSQNALGVSLAIVGDNTGGGGGASIRLGATGYVTFQSTGRVDAGSADIGFKRGSAGVLQITDGSSGYGTLDAAAFKVSGTAGVSGTGTNVTCVNGIVTAIS